MRRAANLRVVRFWIESNVEMKHVGDILLPSPDRIAILSDFEVVEINFAQAEPTEKYRTRTHFIRVEFEADDSIKDGLRLYAEEIEERVIDTVSLRACVDSLPAAGVLLWPDPGVRGRRRDRHPVGDQGHPVPACEVRERAFGALRRNRRVRRLPRRLSCRRRCAIVGPQGDG